MVGLRQRSSGADRGGIVGFVGDWCAFCGWTETDFEFVGLVRGCHLTSGEWEGSGRAVAEWGALEPEDLNLAAGAWQLLSGES